MEHRALQLGEVGEKWLASVTTLVAEIEDLWSLSVGEQLSGGTEALVFAVNSGARSLVLKVGIPDSLHREAEALRLAEGRGYARLVDYDASRDAVLLERLGRRLADSSLSMHQQIEILCGTLKVAWRRIDQTDDLMTGAEKAHAYADSIRAQWEELDPPFSEEIVDRASAYAFDRMVAHDPAASWLIHGDAHIWNALEARDSATGYKFVDPDGLFAERAVDLAVLLREWREDLLSGDTLSVGRARCELLAQLTGVDRASIWQWGFLEHVSSGLLYLRLHNHRAADEHLTIASRWAVPE